MTTRTMMIRSMLSAALVLGAMAFAPDAAQAQTCPESECKLVQAPGYISHFTELNCGGQEHYYTPYFGYDGIRRSWDGGGFYGTTLATVTNKSYRDSGGYCHNDWPSGNTLSNFVRIYRDEDVYQVTGAYISHYTGADCTGQESYYLGYFDFDGVRRSWNGNGYHGTVEYTATNRSWRGDDGVCHNSWPNGNELGPFVRIYR